jgi:anaerobic magnesium-protoporphyrin IX monomethyl ester cyclase
MDKDVKIVLVVPPNISLLPGKSFADEPLGILGLATNIKNICEIKIFDFYNITIKDDNDFNCLAYNIIEEDPDIVGFSVNFSSLSYSASILSYKLKKAKNDVIIVWGGNYSTFMASTLIHQPYIDAIFKYESENNFKKYIESFSSGGTFDDIDGIILKYNNTIIENQFDHFIKDIDSLPINDHSLLPLSNKYDIQILSSRGCPYNCIYCSTTKMWGSKIRYRSETNVIEEIGHIINQYNKKYISFVDDLFIYNKQRLKKLIILKKQRQINCIFGASARIDSLDDECIELMKEFGIDKLFIGVESGDEYILKKLHRRYDRKRILSVIKKINNAGINKITLSFMIGMPWERKINILNTYSLIEEIEGAIPQIHIFSLLPGTEIYENIKRYNILPIYKENNYNYYIDYKINHRTKYLSKDEIEELYYDGLLLIRKKRTNNLLL